MADKARHAFGSRKNLDAAIQSGAIDSYDILFLSGENESPTVGWLDKNGNPVIVETGGSVDTSELENQIAKLGTELESKADVEEVNSKIATKADTTEVEAKLSTKADSTEVDSKIKDAVSSTVVTANSYTDEKIEAAISEHMTKKYEITDAPEGTIISYRENEIRICCPKDAVFTKQNVGTGGDANTYYVTFKTYVYDDNVVGYKEHLGNQTDAEILTDLKTDKYGRRYQPTWLGVAKYDEATGVWNYYGENSTSEKFTGWDYRLDLFDANGVMIASDSVRINLSNENCHSSIEPYYVGKISKEIDTKIEEKLVEINTGYEIVEF